MARTLAGTAITLCAVGGMVAPAQAAPAHEPDQVTVYTQPGTHAKAQTQTPTTQDTMSTTTNLNVRTGAGVKHQISQTLTKGSTIAPTGVTDGTWLQVDTDAKPGWVNGKYLKTTTQTLDQATTRVNLNLRADAGIDHQVIALLPKDSVVSLTGETSRATDDRGEDAFWVQAMFGEDTGWVSEHYLEELTAKADSSPPAKPSTQNKTITRSAAKGDVTANTRTVIDAVQSKFGPSVHTIHDYRAGSVGHSSGKAADIMIRDYASVQGIANGDEIVDYLIANREAYQIDYLIWQDKIWLGQNMGWKPYSASGKYGTKFAGNWNDTTKHLDHIHIETR